MGDTEDTSTEAPTEGLQDATLGIRKTRKIHVQEFLQRCLEALQACLASRCSGSKRRRGLVARLRCCGTGIAKECLANGAVGCRAVGGEEGLSLARLESVAADGVTKTALLLLGECRKRQGYAETQAATLQPLSKLRNEPPCDGEPAFHPGLLPSQELRDGGGGQAILRLERGGHAGFVHGGGGTAGSIGLEEPRLERDARDRLEDDRDLLAAFRAPLGQALESVENFQSTVFSLRDAKRHRREVFLSPPRRAAERSQRSRQALQRHHLDKTHAPASSSARSW